MYIPDRIRIVARGHKAEVFSLDEGHNPDEALPVAAIHVHWSDLYPVSISVEYGSHIMRIGMDDRASPVTVDYPFNRVEMDVITGGGRTEKVT